MIAFIVRTNDDKFLQESNLTEQGLLRVPFACISTRQKRAFAVAGPSIWNVLPLSIRSLPRTFS